MSDQQEIALYEALRIAVREAVEAVGIDGIRELSMFPSSKWNAKNDNQAAVAFAKAA